MYYHDLRELIQALENRGKMFHIEQPIVRETELMPLYRLQFRGLDEATRRGFLFKKVVDVNGRSFDFQVASGIYASSREIYAIGLKCEPNEIKDRWVRALREPIPPVVVPHGPVQEEVHMGAELEEMGLDEIPFPVEEPGFSGTIRTTANCFITKDPETSGYPPGATAEERSYPKPQGASSLLIDATRKWPYPPVGLPKKEFIIKRVFHLHHFCTTKTRILRDINSQRAFIQIDFLVDSLALLSQQLVDGQLCCIRVRSSV